MKTCFFAALFFAWVAFVVILHYLELPTWAHYTVYFAGLGAFVFAEVGLHALEDRLDELDKLHKNV